MNIKGLGCGFRTRPCVFVCEFSDCIKKREETIRKELRHG